jgi:hypothetical protein
MTERKARTTTKATAGPSTHSGANGAPQFAQDDSFCWGAVERQQQIPFGNDRKKSKNNDNGNSRSFDSFWRKRRATTRSGSQRIYDANF